MISRIKKRGLKKVLENILKYIVSIYLLIIIVFLPVYYHNSYFDILEAKSHFFVCISLIFSVLFVLIYAIYFLVNGVNNRVLTCDYYMVVFVVVIFIGTVVADDQDATITGNKGWGVGAEFMLLCVFGYFIVSRFIEDIEKMVNLFLLVGFAVLLLGAFNTLGYDPLYMNKQICSDDYGKYLSTIGNINWYGEYISLILPLVTVLYINCKRKWFNRLYGMITIIALYNSIACNSDCAIISVMITGGYVFWSMLCDKTKFNSSAKMIIIFGLTLILLYLLNLMEILINPLETIQEIICNPIIGSVFFIIGILILFNSLPIEDIFRYRRFIVLCTIFIIFIFIIIMIIVCNTINMEFGIKDYFVFNDKWGTDRGYIWKCSIRIYDKLNFVHKFFGNGCDTFGILINEMFRNEILAVCNKSIVNAHCELLQLLITTGLLGVISYYGAFLNLIERGMREKSVICNAIAITLLSYLIQGLINNFQAISTPFAYIMLGLLANGILKSKYIN